MKRLPDKTELFNYGDENRAKGPSQNATPPDGFTAALEEYLVELESGRAPDKQEYEQRYPELEGLAECLQGLEFVHVVVPQLNDSSNETQKTEIQPLATLGDFRIVREIGRGGMGVVYQAEQLSLGRHVALKILPFASTLDRRQLERFKNEARSAAMLKHPNIVSVFSVGYERGVHYYAMELVEGESLAGAIDRLRANATATRELSIEPQSSDSPNQSGRGNNDTQPVAELSTQHSSSKREYHRSVARLGIQVAEALNYAHEQGVVHRDIKPSNLLLNQHASISISDFGLAQVQGDHNLTMTGDLLGTLLYMSPEQAEGKKLLDHRTDIYSLGVTLHELLTLQPVFVGENRQRLLAQVVENQPCPLRKRDRSIPSDLETIILAATAKHAEDRYDTAQEFADDLRRFLNHEPIKARPPRRWEFLRRTVRRNPVATGLTIMVILLALFLAIAGPLAAISYRQLASDEKQARQNADVSRKQAVDSRQQVQTLLDRAITGIGEAIADPLRLESLQPELLEDVRAYYKELLRTSGDDPDVRLEAAVAQRELGRHYARVSNADSRVSELNRNSLSLLNSLVEEHPANETYAYEQARTTSQQGHLYSHRSNLAAASVQFRRAIAILESLVQRHPEEKKFRRSLNHTRGALGNVTHKQGNDPPEVLRQLLLARTSWQELSSGREPELLDMGGLGACHSALGRQFCTLNRFGESEDELLTALRLYEHVRQSGFTLNPEAIAFVAEANIRYGWLLNCMHRHVEAEHYLQIAINDLEPLMHNHPGFGWGRQSLAIAYGRHLSYALSAGGFHAEADEAIRKSIHLHDELANWSNEHVRGTARMKYRLGQVLWAARKPLDAKPLFKEALEQLGSLISDDPGDSDVRVVRRVLANYLTACPDVEFRDADRAVELAKAIYDPNNQRVCRLLGIASFRAGQWEQAIRALNQSVAIRRGGDAVDWLILAVAHWQIGQRQLAHNWHRQAVESLEQKAPICLDVITHPAQLRDLQREAQMMLMTEGPTSIERQPSL